MATPEEIKRAKELEAIERRRRDLAREMQGISASQAYTRDSVSQAASLTDYARMLTEQMKEQAGINRGRSEVDKSLLSISQQLQKSAQQVTSELGNEYRVQQQIAKDRQLQRDIEIEIASIRKNLNSEQLSSLSQVESLNQSIRDAILDQTRLQQQVDSGYAKLIAAQNGSLSLSQEELKTIEEQINAAQTKLDIVNKEITSQTDLLDIAKMSLPQDAMRLATLEDQLGVLTDIQGIRQAELKTQREITRATGVTGAVVGGIGGIMQRLGMRSGVFNQAMDDAKEAMEELAGEGIKAGKAVSKLEIAMKGVSILAKTAAEVLTDPAVIIGGIVDGFFDLNKAGVQFGQMTGQAADAMHGVNTEVATAVDMLNTASSLTREIGLNAAAIFTPKQVGQISDAVTLLGLGEAAAGRLGLLMNVTGKSADQIGEGVYDTVSALNTAGKSAVAPRQVLDDVLTASEDITLSLGNNPKQLAKAAAAARAFGMTLSQVDNIANSLLDFESSIEAELEAQLLTGKSINMAKARELALNNDLAGLAKELEKQGVSAVEFSKMNRIQQEATAKALGMSRQELSKSLLTQEAQANMTEEQLAAARGVSLEESKRISIQERLQKSIEKLQLAFAPILEALVPIAEMFISMAQPILAIAGGLGKVLASVLKLTPVMFTLKAAALGFAAVKTVGFASQMLAGGQSASMLSKKLTLLNKGMVTTRQLTLSQVAAAKLYNAAQKMQNFLVGVGTKVFNLFSAGIGKVGQMMTWLKNTTLAQSIVQRANNAVTMISNALQNTWIAGAVRRVGLWLAETVQLGANTAAKFANTSATAAQAVANTTLAGTQSAVASTGAAAGSGLAAAGAGLGAFGAAAAPAIPIILAIGAALLMASPAIWALGQMITGIAQVIGNVLMKALEMLPTIIDAVAQGFVTMLGAVTLEKIAALALMGPALISVAGGLGILTASIFTSLPAIAMLGSIALMGPGLMNAGSGIKAMAEGVAKLSEALQSLETSKLEEVKDLITSTAVAAPAVAATGAITSLIQGITGGGGNNEDNMGAKLDELIAAVRSGANVRVYLDSDDITKRTVIESTTLS